MSRAPAGALWSLTPRILARGRASHQRRRSDGGPGAGYRSAASLRRNRDFELFWFVQTLSVAGDSFSYVALPLLVFHATSVAQMGLLTGVAGVASILTGTVAGTVADQVDRRPC